jgi:hypothetical protein
MNYLMSRERKNDVRSTARLVYLNTSQRFITPHLNKPEILRISLGETRQSLVESKKFNSVLGGLMMAIAMKLVTKLIERWLDENLFSLESVPPEFAKGEPGYAEK